MSDKTAILSLPFIMAAQAQKHVTYNETLQTLDALVQLSVIDFVQNEPSGAPEDGARYLVGENASGAFSGHVGEVACWQDGVWLFYTPQEGWIAWVRANQAAFVFTDNAWAPFSASSDSSLNSGAGRTDFVAGEVFIEQNEMAEIPTPTTGGFFAFYLADDVFPQIAHSGIIVYDSGQSLSLLTVYSTPSIDVQGATPLTGIVGDGNKTSIAVQAGKIQLENRRFTNRVKYRYIFLT